MSKEELKQSMLKEESRIHDEIRKLYPNSAGLDGIIDIDSFLDDTYPLKILWVLKERRFPSNKIDQEFDVREIIKYSGQYEKWEKTFGPMCYATEGILEWQRTKEEKYLELKKLFELKVSSETEGNSIYYEYEKDNKIYPMDHIAFLNVKKLGSYENMSKPNQIPGEYAKPEVKKILQEQFNYINPDIIIFGNHVVKLAEDWAGVPITSYTHVGEFGAHDYYYDSERNKLFIFADHPSRPGNKNEYCNSIFNVIKKFSKELLK